MGEASAVRAEIAGSLAQQVARRVLKAVKAIGSASVPYARTCADAVLAVLVAPRCAGCKHPLEHPAGSAVCDSCWTSVHPVSPPFCDGCGEPLPSWRILSIAERRCARCRRRGSTMAIARAAGAYDGTLRALLHALKYDRRRSLAKPIGELMRRHGRDVLDGADIAVPVPLHSTRRRARGFNQAEDLAIHLELPVVRALRRIRATSSQTDLPAAQRHANVRDAFALRRGADVRGRRIVLVDDVSTTGATLEECARVLRQAGATDVRALTAARALARRG